MNHTNFLIFHDERGAGFQWGDNGQMGEGEGGQPPMLGNPVSTSRWMSDTKCEGS